MTAHHSKNVLNDTEYRDNLGIRCRTFPPFILQKQAQAFANRLIWVFDTDVDAVRTPDGATKLTVEVRTGIGKESAFRRQRRRLGAPGRGLRGHGIWHE